jgi:hypothetical protein
MHRLLALVAALLALFGGSLVAASPQDATPAAFPSAVGYPELQVRATETSFELPSQVAAGWWLVTLENATAQDTAFTLMGPAPGETMADLQRAMATPTAGAPPWFYRATLLGGPSAPAGQRAQVLLDLPPGDWLVLPRPGTSQAPVPLVVTAGTGTPPPAAEEPTAAVGVQVTEYAVTGVPPMLPSGPQIWQVTNGGQQPHELYLYRVPETLSAEQVVALASLPEDATPPPGVPGFDQLVEVGGVTPLSGGQTVGPVVDLAPGTYLAASFLPEEATGQLDAARGMFALFAVGDGTAPITATPAA